MNANYSLDKLVVLMRIRSAALDPLLHQLRMGSGERYGEFRGEWMKYRIMEFRYQFTIGVDKESWFFGVQPNKDPPNDYWTTCKVEFNPAKVGNLVQFNEFYSYLISNCKYLDFKRFDVAIDISVPRSHVHIFKDARVLRVLDYGGEDKTAYLGTRLSHSQVKLYNKQFESKLDYPLTRLEITLDYAKSTWVEFERLFPNVFVFDDIPDSFTSTDKVLLLAVCEHPEYFSMLDWRKRKKITSLLDTSSLRLNPDEINYRSIVHEVLTYGKGISVEKFEELEDEQDVDFTHGLGEEVTGEQEEMK